MHTLYINVFGDKLPEIWDSQEQAERNRGGRVACHVVEVTQEQVRIVT